MTIDLNELGKGIHRHIKEEDFQHGVTAERERILKLINPEPGLGNVIDDIYEGVLYHKNTRSFFKQSLIALIKGEK